MLESAKSIVERVTGFRRPSHADLAVLVAARKANTFRLKDDGETPNNPKFPLVLYGTPVKLAPDYDPAAVFEALFESNGWGDGWRDSMYDWLHWHTGTHEVLGIARGWLKAQFGGAWPRAPGQGRRRARSSGGHRPSPSVEKRRPPGRRRLSARERL